MFGLFERRLPEPERVALYKEALEREQEDRNRILYEMDSYRTVMHSEVARNKALGARIEAARAALNRACDGDEVINHKPGRCGGDQGAGRGCGVTSKTARRKAERDATIAQLRADLAAASERDTLAARVRQLEARSDAGRIKALEEAAQELERGRLTDWWGKALELAEKLAIAERERARVGDYVGELEESLRLSAGQRTVAEAERDGWRERAEDALSDAIPLRDALGAAERQWSTVFAHWGPAGPMHASDLVQRLIAAEKRGRFWFTRWQGIGKSLRRAWQTITQADVRRRRAVRWAWKFRSERREWRDIALYWRRVVDSANRDADAAERRAATLHTERDALARRVETLTAALGFYADRESWKPEKVQDWILDPPAKRDVGGRARAALTTPPQPPAPEGE